MSKETILVLDDDANLRKSLSAILATKGFTPMTAASGREALEKTRGKTPEVALIDLKLQDMSGLEVMRALKERAPDVECIVLTGHATQISAIEAINLGAYSYVQKPYDPEQLLLTIHRAIEKKKGEQLLAEKELYFRTLLHSIREDILVIDREYRVVDVNNSVLITLGQPREKVIGRHCFEISHRYNTPCDEHGEQCMLHQVFETGEACQYLHAHIRGDGSQIQGNILLSPMKDAQGMVTHVVKTVHDVTEMLAMKEALRESEETYRTLVERATDGIVMIQNDLLRFVNARMAELLGYSVKELVGQPYDRFLTEDELPRAAEYYARRMAGDDAPFIYESIIKHKDGSRLEVEFNAGLTMYQGQPADLIIVRDITERKQVEKEIRQRTEDLALVNHLNEAVSRGQSLGDIIALLAQETQRIFSSHAAAVYLFSEDRQHLVIPNLSLSAGLARQIQQLLGFEIPPLEIPLKADSLYREWIEKGEPRIVRDPETIQQMMAEFTRAGQLPAGVGKTLRKLVPRIYKMMGIQTIISIPLLSEGERIGILDISSSGDFQETDLRRLTTLSRQLTAIIKRKQTEEALKQRAAQLALLNDIGEKVAAVLDLDSLLDRATRLVHDSFGYHHVALFTVDNQRGELVMRAKTGAFASRFPLNHRLKLGQGVVGWVGKSGQTLLANDVEVEPRYVNLFPDLIPTRSELSVPIQIEGKTLGVLDVQSPRPNAFDENDITALETLTSQIAVALENARLFREAKRELAERERAEKELAHSLSVLRATLESTADGILVVNQEGVWENFNQKFLEMWSIPSSIAASRDDAQALAYVLDQLKNPDSFFEKVRELYGKPDAESYDILEFKSGRVLERYSQPQQIGQESVGRVWSFRDVTEQVRAEDELRAEKDRAQQYLDIAGVAIVALDRSGCITLANKRLLDLLGYQEAELMGRNWFETCLPARVRKEVYNTTFEHIMTGDTQAAEYYENEVVTQEGQERIVAWHNALLRNSEGDIVGTLSSGEDITERVRAEEEILLRNRELALLNRIIAASATMPSAEALLETACRELALAFDVPQSAAALFNKEKTESVLMAEYRAEGRPSALGEIIPVAGNPVSQHLLQHKTPLVVNDAQTDPRQEVVRDLMDRRGTVSLLMLPLIVDGEVIGSLGVDTVEPSPPSIDAKQGFSAREIDLAQRVAEQVSGALARLQLEETQRRLNAAIEQSAEAVVITDIRGSILYVNPAFERISGYSQTEALGRNPRILKSGEHDAVFYHNLWQTISAGKVWHGRFVNRRKDGNLYTEDATISPVRNRAGEIVNYVAVKYDVTREVALEEQFYQAQKMEAIGQLAGGVAHDFGNLLTVIHLSTRLLEKELHPHDVIWKHVERIQAAGQRATRLTRQLLSFSRKDVIEPQVLNLNQVLDELGKMLRRMIREDIEMTLLPGEDLWPVLIDDTHLDQVIVNLAVNARDAMPQGGVLTIETKNVVLDRAYAATHIRAEPGDYVLMTVSDTGIGMSSEVRAHIFEPFFTTKERGQGTGLGLATVYGIVERSGGHIQIHSEVGQGSSFHIYLPRTEEGAEIRQIVPSRTEVMDVRGTETILVVEDASDVRELAVDILETYGYHILAADNGQRALLLSRGYDGPIHLLLTDVVMPGMSGTELAVQLQGQRPEMRVLYTSGYTDEAIVHLGVLEESVTFLRKPFTLEGLTESVRTVLDSEE